MASRSATWRPVVLLAGGALGVLAAGLLARALLPGHVLDASPEGLLGAAGAWAYPLYLLLFVVLTLTFLPTSPLSLAAGFLFGPVAGVLCAWAGAFAGGAAAYGMGRTGRRPFRDALLARVPPVQRLLERHPFAAVLAARLLLMPHGPASYGLGLAGVRARDFLVGSALGLLPLAVVLALVGAGFRDEALLTPAFLLPLAGALAVMALGAWAASRPREAQALSRGRGMTPPLP